MTDAQEKLQHLRNLLYAAIQTGNDEVEVLKSLILSADEAAERLEVMLVEEEPFCDP